MTIKAQIEGITSIDINIDSCFRTAEHGIKVITDLENQLALAKKELQSRLAS